MFHVIIFTVFLAIIFEPCCVSSTENGINVNRTDLTKILGGSEFPIEKYPFVVSVQRHSDYGSFDFHTCGGTLVRADWVLTAAHCLVYLDEDSDSVTGVFRVRHPKRYTVLAGLTDVDLISRDHPNRMAVRSLHTNKYYYPLGQAEDIGLMRLVSKFRISQQIKLTPLPERSSYDNLKSTTCFAVGWGMKEREKEEKSRDAGLSDENMIGSNVNSDSRSEFSPNNLKAVDLNIIPISKCRELYGNFWTRPYISHEYQLCVEELLTKAALKGDSGGPLLCDDIQMGLTSYGDVSTEGPKFKPTVYTRVDFYLDWINETVSRVDA